MKCNSTMQSSLLRLSNPVALPSVACLSGLIETSRHMCKTISHACRYTGTNSSILFQSFVRATERRSYYSFLRFLGTWYSEYRAYRLSISLQRVFATRRSYLRRVPRRPLVQILSTQKLFDNPILDLMGKDSTTSGEGHIKPHWIYQESRAYTLPKYQFKNTFLDDFEIAPGLILHSCCVHVIFLSM